MNSTTTLLDTINDSDFYREYEHAFCNATGLPLTLRPTETWNPPFHGKKNENKFCAMMAQKNATCAACLNLQERLTKSATAETALMRCHFGMTEIAVPLKLGTERIGILATGQVLTQSPTADRLEHVEKNVKKLNPTIDVKKAMDAYKETPVMPRNQLAGFVTMLEKFAEHLGVRSNQIALHQANAEPIAITRAKAVPRPSEKITAADEKAQRAARERDAMKELGQREVRFHSEVTRKRKEHRVHCQRGAKSQADDQRAIAALHAAHGTAEISERLNLACKCKHVEFAGTPFQVDASERRIDVNCKRTGLFLEQLLDEPHAANTGDSVQIELQFASSVGEQMLQPFVVALLKLDGLYGEDAAILQLVELRETVLFDQAVDELTTRAAEVGTHARCAKFGSAVNANFGASGSNHDLEASHATRGARRR